MNASRAFSLALAAVAALPLAAATVSTRPVSVLPRDGELRRSGPWMVEVDAPGEFESTVLDADGNAVAGPFAEKSFPVPDPLVWSAESPVCYTLSMRREDGETETVPFAFFTRRIVGGRLYVNSRPVRVKFGPRELNGNAAFAARMGRQDALRDGYYLLTGAEAASIAHETASENPAATFHRFRDWTAQATNWFGRVAISNRNVFSGPDGTELRWTLLLDGEESGSGKIPLNFLAPGETTVVDMPEKVLEATAGSATIGVRFEFVKDGKVVASDQADIVESRDLKPVCPPRGFFASMLPSPSAKADMDGDDLVLSAGGVRLTFDAATGLPRSFERVRLAGNRPLFDGVSFSNSMLGAPSRTDAKPRSSVGERAGALSFSSLTLFGYGFGKAADAALSAVWTMHPNGVAACRARIAQGAMEGVCPLVFSIPCDTARRDWRTAWIAKRTFGEDVPVEWFGLGPALGPGGDAEGAFLGRWKSDASSPVRSSSVRGVKVGDLAVRTLSAPFSFSLDPDPDNRRLVLYVYAAPNEDTGVADLSFTLSAGDGELTARSPEGAFDAPAPPRAP